MTNATGTPRTFVISVNQKNLHHSILLNELCAAADLLFGPQELTMFDDSLRLRENPHLVYLLSHYAQMGTEDRATWRDRLMQMDGVEPKEISALHGELIAFEWIEQNTGQAIARPDGTLSACYRITLNGLREYRHIQGIEIPVEAPETAERKRPNFPRKKQKSDSPEAPVDVASEESLVPAA